MCCRFCPSFGEQPNFPFSLSLASPCPVPWMLIQSSQAPCPAPWLQPPLLWSSSNQKVPKWSWGDTLCGKELEHVASFHARERPFAAGAVPVQQEAFLCPCRPPLVPGRCCDRICREPVSSGAGQHCWAAQLARHCCQALHSQGPSGNHPAAPVPAAGLVLAGPGFLKARVRAPVSIIRAGVSAAAGAGLIGEQELLPSVGAACPSC